MGAGGPPHIAPFPGFRGALCRGSARGDVIDPDRVAGVVGKVTASGRVPACTAM